MLTYDFSYLVNFAESYEYLGYDQEEHYHNTFLSIITVERSYKTLPRRSSLILVDGVLTNLSPGNNAKTPLGCTCLA